MSSLYIPGVVVIPRLHGDTIETEAPRALLVGPYPLVLAALAQLVSGPPLNVSVEVATRIDDALNCLEHADYQLVFCDLRSPPIPATELPAQVRQRQLATRVVLLSDEEDARELVAALDCGAAGFFTKDASADEFVQGVQAVAAGHLVIGRSLARHALARLAGRQPASGGLDDRLSPAERSILALLGQAYTTRAIAAARGISDKTVRNHMASIYRKLEVRNRSEAMMWSLRMSRTQIGAG